jgi:hypothetical protein
MTKKFDSLLKQMLNENFPADISGFEGGMGGAVNRIMASVPEGEPKGHLAPLQKLPPQDREAILKEIFKEVFSEKENTYSPLTDNPEQLHGAIQSAIQKVSSRTALKAQAKWASKFLADRMMTQLKDNVQYTTAGGEEAVQKEMTQKEFKQALNKALQEPPKTEPEAPAAEEPTEEQPAEEKDVDFVYIKAADLNSDDADLQKAFNKLPEDKEMSWEEVVKAIKLSPALALLDAGGLSEIEKEREVGEEEDVKALDFDDEDTPDLSKFDRLIDPYFRTTRGSYELPD